MNCLRCTNNVVDIQQDIDFASLPLFEITSPPTSIDHLASSDVDLHLPYDMSFQYYNSHEFHDNHYINIFLTDAFLLCTAILGPCQITLIICNICCLNYICLPQ